MLADLKSRRFNFLFGKFHVQGKRIMKNRFTTNFTSGLALLWLSILIFQPSTCCAQGTAFTYAGRLANNGALANGSYDLQFALFDDAAAGNPVGSALTTNAVAVSNGLFTVTLDFGAGVFPGADRWLNLSVKTNGAASFTPLTPRQQITSPPYAIRAGNFSGPVAASQITGTLASSNIGVGSISSTNLAVGAAAANLNAISQSGVASGGVVLSLAINPALAAAGYVKI